MRWLLAVIAAAAIGLLPSTTGALTPGQRGVILVPGISCDTAGNAVLNSLSATNLTGHQRALVCSTVSALEGAGMWTIADMVHFECAPTTEFSLKNWVSPGTFDLTATSPQFTAYQGYAGDGAAAFLDPGVNITGLTHFTQNSAAIGIYTPTEAASNTSFVYGDSGASATTLGLWRSAGNNAQIRINDAVTLSGANTNTRGTMVADRTTSAARQIYINAVNIANDTQASAVLPTQHLVFLKSNVSFAPSTTVIGADYVGASLTAAQAAAWNSISTNYCTKIANP
jgi:hypothetical protein